MRNRKKLRNKIVIYDDIKFQSIREAKRYKKLISLQNMGKISDLEMQKKYELIPAHYETVETGEYYVKGSKKGLPKTKRVCVEQAVCYYADFVYKENGEIVVEDAKGYKNPSCATYAEFVIKRKMMLYFYGIRIREV